MNQREFIQVYEESNDESGFEYVNPNVIMAIGITSIEDDLVQVTATNVDNNERVFEFLDVKEAQRFIKRVGGTA